MRHVPIITLLNDWFHMCEFLYFTSHIVQSSLELYLFPIQRRKYDRAWASVCFPRQVGHLEIKFQFTCEYWSIVGNVPITMTWIQHMPVIQYFEQLATNYGRRWRTCLTYVFTSSSIFLRDNTMERTYGPWAWLQLAKVLDIISLALLIQFFSNLFQPHVQIFCLQIDSNIHQF